MWTTYLALHFPFTNRFNLCPVEHRQPNHECLIIYHFAIAIHGQQQLFSFFPYHNFLQASSSQLLDVQEFIQAVVLPFLNNSNMEDNIPTVLALKLLDTAMETVSVVPHLLLLKRHLPTIIICLCELLNDCNVFWKGMAPEHSLLEMEELRELVLKALDIEIKISLEVIKINPSFARAVEWLLKRIRDGFGN